MLLKYVISYPFSPIFVAKVHHFISFLLIAILWLQNRAANFQSSTSFTFVAVFDLLALLCTLLSVWLTVQKCYIVRVELAFTSSSIVLLVFSSLCTIPAYRNDVRNVILAINIIHGYAISLLSFAGVWAYCKTKTTISRLLIRGWGDADDDDQLEQFDFDVEEA